MSGLISFSIGVVLGVMIGGLIVSIIIGGNRFR